MDRHELEHYPNINKEEIQRYGISAHRQVIPEEEYLYAQLELTHELGDLIRPMRRRTDVTILRDNETATRFLSEVPVGTPGIEEDLASVLKFLHSSIPHDKLQPTTALCSCKISVVQRSLNNTLLGVRVEEESAVDLERRLLTKAFDQAIGRDFYWTQGRPFITLAILKDSKDKPLVVGTELPFSPSIHLGHLIIRRESGLRHALQRNGHHDNVTQIKKLTNSE